jgi:hypothetical protein
MEDRLPFGLVQVDGDGFLIAIGDLEHQTAPIGELLRLAKHGARPTREISLSRFFHLNDSPYAEPRTGVRVRKVVKAEWSAAR